MFAKAWIKRWLRDEEQESETLGEQLAEQAKQLAYRELFRQSRFDGCDGLNEYDLDYSSYHERGDLIPEEMRQAMARLQADEQAGQTPSEHQVAGCGTLEEAEQENGTDNIA